MGRLSKKQAAAAQTLGRSPDYRWGGPQTVDVQMADLIPLGLNNSVLNEMRKMWLFDETASAMRWCILSTMEQVPWKHAPQVDGKTDPQDEEAVKYAAFADTLLDDIQGGFASHVEDALAMIWAGFAPCEIITKQRDGIKSRFADFYWGVSKIPLRDPRTIGRWDYDDDQNLVAVGQYDVYATKPMPIWKVCHYRTTSELGNPQGIPLLLGAYRVWKLKTRIQDSEAIGIERELVGLPIFRMPEQMYLDSLDRNQDGSLTPEAERATAAIKSAKEAVSNLRLNKTGGIVLFSNTWSEDRDAGTDTTPKWDFKILTTGGQRTIDTRQPIRDYDRAIARVLMMQFLHLGDRSTGSYALSDDQSSMAYKSFMALALKVAREWSLKVLPLIWQANGFPNKYLPLLEPGQINKQSMQALGQFMTGLGKVAGLWESDPKARGAILDRMDIPYDRNVQNDLAGTAKETLEAAADAAASPPPTIGAPAPAGAEPEED